MRRIADLVLLVALIPLRGQAQGREIPLSKWQHSSWTGDAGPPATVGDGMWQSSDGYLWIGTSHGLLRFDGVRFALIDSTVVPELGPGASTAEFWANNVDRSGVLWVSGSNGRLLSYRDGRFTVVANADTGDGGPYGDDRDGRLWLVNGRLVTVKDGKFVPVPLPKGVPDSDFAGLESDTGSGHWLGTDHHGLYHIVGDSVEHFGRGRLRLLLQSADGALWTVGDDPPGIRRYADGKWATVPDPVTGAEFYARSATEAPDGSVWIPQNYGGALRWHHGIMERFGVEEGLSSPVVRNFLVSNEGVAWVATDLGLDRLRPAPFAIVGSRDGLPGPQVVSYEFERSGAIWNSSASTHTLYLHDDGMIRGKSGPIRTTAYPFQVKNPVDVLAGSRRGGIWVDLWTGVGYFDHGRIEQRFGAESGVPRKQTGRAVEGSDGTLWMDFMYGDGFGRLRDGRYRSIELPGGSRIRGFVADGEGRLWVGLSRERFVVAYQGDSIVRKVMLPGPNPSPVQSLAFEKGDTLWAASRQGAYRIAGGRAVAVPLPSLQAMLDEGVKIEVGQGFLWLANEIGIARIPLSDLHAAADGKTAPVAVTRFDALDGLPQPRAAAFINSPIRIAPDGRVWISTPAGLAVASGNEPSHNPIPPRPAIEELSVGGVRFPLANGVTIAPNVERIAIHFSAPGLGLPERMRVEYRLDGADHEWQDGAPPRVATYSQLQPGRYRFRVRAWNEDGIPSRQEATLDFRVLAAWYQQWWFYGLIVAAIAGATTWLAIAVQHRRNRRTAVAAEARFEAVLAERARLARELHDTLLQGFTGVTLQVDGVRASLAKEDSPLADELFQILGRADQTLREAREMVWEIREPGVTDTSLGDALAKANGELPNPDHVEIQHVVNGGARPVAPAVGVAVLRIGREATINALRHAKARHILVQLTYEPRRVLLEIRDDGCGADPAVFDLASASGHWGIAGMRERARGVGGTLTITTAPQAGMRIVVALPAEAIGEA